MNNSIFRKNLYLMHKSGGIPRNGGLGEKLLWDAEKKQRLERGGSSGSWENYDSGEPYTPSLIDKSSSSGGGKKGSGGHWAANDGNDEPYTPPIIEKVSPNSTKNNKGGSSGEWTTAMKSSAGTRSSGSSSSRKLADPSSNWSGEIKRSATTYTPPSSGWGKEGSQEFKDNKKEYNQWYYQQHKDYWKNYYGTKGSQKSAMSGDPRYSAPKSYTNAMSGDSRYSAPKSYTNAMSGDPRYSVQNTSPSYSNAMAGDPRYAAPTMRVSDLVKQSRRSISTGNDFISSSTNAGFGSSSIENLWKSGAKSIINAGKSFLNAWKSGFGF